MSAALASELLAPYGAAFESVRAVAGQTEAVRSQAFARFAELGFPAARDEAWKYTSLRRLESRRFQAARRPWMLEYFSRRKSRKRRMASGW